MPHVFVSPRPAPVIPARSPRARAAIARRAGAVVVGLVGALVLAGCAPTVSVEVAPYATDPVCARIVLALPDLLNGMPRVQTSSQATAAWGDTAQKTIQLRCGVEVPGPTTDECVTVTDESGRDVDWLTVQDPVTKVWTLTTYGRSPAVELTVPAGMSTSPAVELSTAISFAAPTRNCL